MEIAREPTQSQIDLTPTSSNKNETRQEQVANTYRVPKNDKLVFSEEIPTQKVSRGKFMSEVKHEFSSLDLDVSVRFEKDINMMVVDILDKESKEVIKSIPPEYVVEMRKKMKQMTDLSGEIETKKGFLVDTKI